MKIKNFRKLAVSEERKKLLKIIEAGLEAIDTKKAVANSVKIEKGKLLIYSHAFSLKTHYFNATSISINVVITSNLTNSTNIY